MATAAPADPNAAAPAKSKSGLIMMAAAVVLSVGASGGVSFFMAKKAATAAVAAAPGGEHEAAPAGEHGEAAGGEHGAPAAANYLPLEPALVVNIDDGESQRFLQAEIQVMSRDAAVLEQVKTHMPRIRNALLMLMGQLKPTDVNTREGKEKLQATMLEEIQKIMKEETGKPAVEALYFTSFVMQ